MHTFSTMKEFCCSKESKHLFDKIYSNLLDYHCIIYVINMHIETQSTFGRLEKSNHLTLNMTFKKLFPGKIYDLNE